MATTNPYEYLHAKFLVYFAQDEAINCIMFKRPADEIHRLVENQCIKFGQRYHIVMQMMMEPNGLAEVKALFSGRAIEAISPTSDGSVFNNMNTKPTSLPSPPRTSSSLARSPPEAPRSNEMVYVYNNPAHPVEERFCSMRPSNTHWGFVSAALLNRFRIPPPVEPCDGVWPHLDAVGGTVSPRGRVRLTWSRTPFGTTNEDYFFILETPGDADLLVGDPQVGWTNNAPYNARYGSHAMAQPSPQRQFQSSSVFQHGEPVPSHETAQRSRHSTPNSTCGHTLPRTWPQQRAGLPYGNPRTSSPRGYPPGEGYEPSETPRAPMRSNALPVRQSTGTTQVGSTEVLPTASSDLVTLKYAIGSVTGLGRLDLNDVGGAEFLLRLGKFYRRANRRSLDRSTHSLCFTPLKDSDVAGSSHVCSLDELDFDSEWSGAIAFIQTHRGSSCEFRVEIQDDDQEDPP